MKLLESLNANLGKTIHESDWLRVTQNQINQFSTATLDHQWIHTDPERASKESPFGGTIAHGYLTLSLYPYLRGLVNESTPLFPGVKQVVNYGINKLRLMSPVVAEKKIKGSSVLKEVKETPNGIQITETFTVNIENEEKPAMVGELLILLM